MKFRKKPVVVEAVRWQPDENGNLRGGWPSSKDWSVPRSWSVSPISLSIFIPTLEGTVTAQVGDWIIRGVRGEFYPCKPDIFKDTYEPLEFLGDGGKGGNDV